MLHSSASLVASHIATIAIIKSRTQPFEFALLRNYNIFVNFDKKVCHSFQFVYSRPCFFGHFYLLFLSQLYNSIEFISS